jgi:hypothetical protein
VQHHRTRRRPSGTPCGCRCDRRWSALP